MSTKAETDVVIRQATVADAEVLAQLGARLFEQTFGDDNTPENMREYLASAFSVDAQRDELSDVDRAVWLAVGADRTNVGYAILRRGTRASGVTGSRPAEVQRIYADRTWHGHGVGNALMNACRAQATAWNCDELWLGVWERNPRAIAFYVKAGFHVVGHQSFMLGRDVQQDLVMSTPLSA